MYTPENHAQMFEILTALRTYAFAHRMPELAERLDDALVLLAGEGRHALSRHGKARGCDVSPAGASTPTAP